MSSIHKLKKALPWAQTPIIINAPMSGAATSNLAVARSLAQQFEQARHQLHDLMSSRKDTPKPVLPVGVGMIVFGSPAVHWLSLFSEYRPAVAWLSFRTTDEFRAWAEGIRKASQYTQVWIQVGSVSAALEATQACYPDALVLQGSDAGGHGHAYGASVVSLIVAGGIMDGRGVAAATMLGAAGVVMGTRFLAAEETDLPSEFRKAVFKATDGGQSTFPWPEVYGRRCLRNTSYEYIKRGVSMDSMRRRLYQDLHGAWGQRLEFKETVTVWAGTGVGTANNLGRPWAGYILTLSIGSGLS
ncbi:nitronate monooxygenase [Aspergillus alliaceus]|uniref:nitronate monooxygenase n=1 Tax=Petromyces alliaceus TaxID=209559 RepID=UPI0012A3ED45|nr:uncharacterized protein BDW43DRAFT_300357 [Aspergillus alliaceus]KAB8233521.1 hypothetical protein BDW43DRAFT_300357 [Aspergillus alliaceus]